MRNKIYLLFIFFIFSSSYVSAQNFSYLKNLPCPDVGMKRTSPDVEWIKSAGQRYKDTPEDYMAVCEYGDNTRLTAYWSEAASRKNYLCNLELHSQMVDNKEPYQPAGDKSPYLTGFGMHLKKFEEDEFIVVESLLEGGSAEGAGIAKGDRIYKVNNKGLKGLTVMDVVTLTKGKLGEEVSYEIESAKDNMRRTIRVPIKKFKLPFISFNIASPTHYVHILTRFPNHPESFEEDKSFWHEKAIEFAQEAEKHSILCRAPEVSEKGPVAE